MGNIVILDENTANKIAAGEVVERPASVVKEMVENSIDAGANNISVEVRNGGISYIKVTDNGSGINEDDVEIAFERHATSKIRSADDLDSIATLGFRGEALASIAAVSNVELTSRVAKNTHGTYIHIQGGVVKDVRQTGCPVGTTFIVKDLFYNTPARYKFLKKDTTEAGYVSDILSRIALGNPQIAIRLMSNNAAVLHTPGNNDLQSVIFSVYGKETAHAIVEVNYADERIAVSGYIGKPEIARSNRNYQSIFINRRYIRSKIITSAIDEAYKTYLMKSKFPFVVLNLEINPQLIDINVHPTKMEVRFSEENEIFRSIYHAVQSALLAKPLVKNAQWNEKVEKPFRFSVDPNEKKEYIQQKFTTEAMSVNEAPALIEGVKEKKWVETSQVDIKHRKEEAKETQILAKALAPIKENSIKAVFENKPWVEPELPVKEESYKVETVLLTERKTSETIIEKNCISVIQKVEEAPVIQKESIENARIIGQAFSTYFILQQGDELLFIDQHAAHERIMYERLMQKLRNSESICQMLISPVVVELTHQEVKCVEENKDIFNKLGFIHDNFGNNSIIIRSVPNGVDMTSVKTTFMEVLDRVTTISKEEKINYTDEAIYAFACKAAVKANTKLGEIEIKEILSELAKLENPFFCPHGRPTIIRFTQQELERKFKRIL